MRGDVPTSAALSALVATPTSGPAGKHRLNPADDSAYLFQINPGLPVHRLGSEGAAQVMFANNLSVGSSHLHRAPDPESLVDNYGRSGDRGVNFNCPHLEPGQGEFLSVRVLVSSE